MRTIRPLSVLHKRTHVIVSGRRHEAAPRHDRHRGDHRRALRRAERSSLVGDDRSTAGFSPSVLSTANTAQTQRHKRARRRQTWSDAWRAQAFGRRERRGRQTDSIARQRDFGAFLCSAFAAPQAAAQTGRQHRSVNLLSAETARAPKLQSPAEEQLGPVMPRGQNDPDMRDAPAATMNGRRECGRRE